ncbi:hypothetical protein EMIT051CA3_70297 [Pseudomonas chlororaphis]
MDDLRHPRQRPGAPGPASQQRLRQWLMENGYRILDEEVAQEKRFNYEINVADAPGR